MNRREPAPPTRSLPSRGRLRAGTLVSCLLVLSAPLLRADGPQIRRIPTSAAQPSLGLEHRAELARDERSIENHFSDHSASSTFRLAQEPMRPEWAPLESDSMPRSLSSDSGIQVRPRGGMEGNFRLTPRGDELVGVVSTPTQISLLSATGVVEISADRIVFWTPANSWSGIDNLGAQNAPVELYMEGNIEFIQGSHRYRAERMYYDVQRQSGVILDAELYSNVGPTAVDPLAQRFPMPFRVKADVLRQLSPTRIAANNAAFTTSLIGVPRYWIQSETLSLDTGTTSILGQLSQARNPSPDATPADLLSQFDQLRVASQNSALYLGNVPVFRWPTFTTDLANNPSLYIDRFRIGNDSVYGTQILTRWDNFQLLGITPNENTNWVTSLDYLSDRGLGFGSDFEYEKDSFFRRPAHSQGFLHSWFIDDDGLDNLGEDRREVPLEETFRGRLRGQHRHRTPSGFQVTGEVGWISDRNFLEQYYEQEWDLEKDQSTALELKRFLGSSVWSVRGNLRVNDFFTQTEWLPRADHYSLGRALLGNHLTWYEHSQIGYGRLRTADAPTNPVDSLKFDPLAWEIESEGIRAISRQELDLPLQWGAVKVVPYVLAEFGHWQEDLAGDQLTRLLGQAGIRSSIPFVRIDPMIQNELFNIQGLAHKVVLEAEYFVADASEDFRQLPLYDELDDDSIEFFRRRFLFDTFQGTFGDNVPWRYDERNFALRSGMQRSVAAASSEIADDLMMFRFGARHRVQTKRGVPGSQRIVDWFTFDAHTSVFPRADRDNFGQEIGPATYDMRWHVGDRTTVLSDGYFDFFGDGLRTISLGLALSRPERSSYYVSIRSIEGPISSNVLTSSASYRLSEKWLLNYGSSVDFSNTGNIGQSGSMVRIGESFLVSVGAHYDASRDNFGLRFDIAPRFLKSRLGRIGNRPILPVGARGLE